MLPKAPVNRTKLHPHGVTPHIPHSQIEEELSEKAHIDYNHVAIQYNPSVASLYEDALVYESGSAITSTGALTTSSGSKTRRSPEDKRIVDEPSSSSYIWWGPVNKPMPESVWKVNRERAVDYLNICSRIYVFDGYAGWDKRYRLKVRVVCSRAYHCLFIRNLLVRPTDEELKSFGTPDLTIYNAGAFPANKYTLGMTSTTSVAINFKNREIVILGTEYAGEMKKVILTVMCYLMPLNHNVLGLYCAANVGKENDVTLLFGFNGTGKTTLSVDPNRFLIGSDGHCWTDSGVFNIEGGCYAKCIGLSSDEVPEIFDAIRFGSVLENVVFDPVTRIVDYNDSTLTDNTRCAYPIEYISNARIPCITDSHPVNVIFLTRDELGVLPPVSKLDKSQIMYYFVSGYTFMELDHHTSQAIFIPCFGQPFLVFHPIRYARMLIEKISQHKATAWLVNTGWVGRSLSKGGKRFPLKYTRAILDAIHDGTLAKGTFETFDVFNLRIPTACHGVPSELLDPFKAWDGSSAEFRSEVLGLAKLFKENFAQYETQVSQETIVCSDEKTGFTDIKAAGPTV